MTGGHGKAKAETPETESETRDGRSDEPATMTGWVRAALLDATRLRAG